jgi:hypothetical protein
MDTTIALIIVGVLLAAAFVAAAGGFDRGRRVRRVRRTRVVERPVERVVERPVRERRIVD